MLEPVFPDSNFITFESFCKSPANNPGQVILFDNDQDFIDFCVAPDGQYTEIYKKCLDAGMKFGFRDEDSTINKRKVADAGHFIQLPVQGIENLIPMLHYICDGEVFSIEWIVPKFVYELVYKQGNTKEEVIKILQACCKGVIADEEYEKLDEEEKDTYKTFKMKRVRYCYQKIERKKLLELADAQGVHIEDIVIRKPKK